MTDKQAILDLIERLEKATEPSRELDYDIACAVLDHRKNENYYAWQGSRPKGQPERTIREFWASKDRCPRFTSSIDAALTLCADYRPQLFERRDGTWIARLCHKDSGAVIAPFETEEAIGKNGGKIVGLANAALAISSTALRARLED